jgi:hypothetical protein
MDTNKNTPRLLGATFLIVVLTSLTGGLLLSTVVGSGNISEILINIANKITLMRMSILIDLVTSVGVIVLATLLYIVLNNQNKPMALVAYGLWLGEAFSIALSKTAAFALIPLSLDFVKAGTPELSYYQTMGDFLYYGVVGIQGQTMHMFFYCLGGILWYYLFYKSKYIPRAISLWGLIAVSVALVGIVLKFFDFDVPIIAYLPILPFEITIGFWLLIKGVQNESVTLATSRMNVKGSPSRENL